MKKKSFLLLAVLAFTVALGAVALPKLMKPMIPNLQLIAGNDYADEWKRVDALANEGQPKSARELVKLIEQKALQEQNGPQKVRAVLYLNRFDTELEEHATDTIQTRMAHYLSQSQFPERQIFHFLLGKYYREYYQAHLWEIQSRTALSGDVGPDIETWDGRTLVDRSVAHLREALAPVDSLFGVDLAYIDALLSLEKGSREFRPTLYDLLAHETIAILSEEAMNLPQPANRFVLDDQRVFAPSEAFTKWTPETTDTTSFAHFCLTIFRNLEFYHGHEGHLAARVDAQVARLRYMHAKSVVDAKDSLYLGSLLELFQSIEQDPFAVKVAVDIATYYSLHSPQSASSSSEHADYPTRLLNLVEAVTTKHPQSPYIPNLKKMAIDAVAPSLELEKENVVYPNRPSYIRVEYKNVSQISCRILKATPDQYRAITEKWDKIPGELAKLPVVGKAWKVELPGSGDHNPHAALVDLPALPVGTYIIQLANTPLFREKDQHAYAYLAVSKFGYSVLGAEGGNQTVQVFDRESGVPLPKVTVEFWDYGYDYTKRRYENRLVGTSITNEKGAAKVDKLGNDYRQYQIRLKDATDALASVDYISFWRRGKSERQTRTTFFLDRAIYRPGQTIYFKGMVLDHDGDGHQVKAGYKTTVTLIDANYQRVSSQDFVTNAYGSFTGTFTAPSSGLTGQMHLETSTGNIYFSVEEYKRPKFEVSFEPTKGNFKLGQKVTATGTAKAYAGSNIDGAKVAYRVVRQARFPWWCSWWWRPMPQSSSMEIAHGETVTDGEGKFDISFDAIPDKSISLKDNPQFSYIVYADVTDITGETRSAETRVEVGTIAMQVTLGIATEWKQDADEWITVHTQNLNGVKEKAKGEIRVYSLKEPDRIYRTKPFGETDQTVMSEKDFHQKFPFDPFLHEHEVSQFPKEKELIKVDFDTDKSDSVLLKGVSGWEEGTYLAVLKTQDAFGTPIVLERYFTLYSLSKTQYAGITLLGAEATKDRWQPGDIAQVAVWSGDASLPVRYDIELKGDVIESGWVDLSKNRKMISVPITEAFRGNAFVHFTAFRRGQLVQESVALNVPWSNKDLKVTFETFRDKLAPGQMEEWRIKITGPQSEPVAAEMLAAMYDASLDAFAENQWYFSVWESRWQQFYRSGSWISGSQHGESFSKGIPFMDRLFQQGYDQFNDFGWGGYGYRTRGGRRTVSYLAREQSESEEEMDMLAMEAPAPPADEMMKEKKDLSPVDGFLDSTANKPGTGGEQQSQMTGGLDKVKVRTNLNETAFFYPSLMTNEKGEVIVKFTVPESLTRWKIMTLAHTQDLKIGQTQKELVTQKDLMVMPHAPRFMREGDRITFTAKVTNMSDHALSGQAVLELFDALTMKPVNAAFGLPNAQLSFSVEKGRSAPLAWELKVPEGIQAITYRVKAAAGNFTDGEESTLPILTNRMLVTESMPLPVRGKQTRNFTFKTLAENRSSTLKHHRYTLEFTSSPIWYAVQALPYLMEYPYECTEQTFNRYYANSLATFVANSNPAFKRVFEQWKQQGSDALLSNLEKNQELKSLLLEETPWVMDAKDETERKKRLGLLFDLNTMANAQEQAFAKLQKAQTPNGGFSWFPGMPDSPYITQYVLVGLAHLHKLGTIDLAKDRDLRNMALRAQAYVDDRMQESYERLKRQKVVLKDYQPGVQEALYLYGRTMLPDMPVDRKNQEAFDFYVQQSEKFVLQTGHYQKGLVALALYRLDAKNATVPKIVKSLKETSIQNDEMGMYWKGERGWFWYQAPIETHALLIEVFQEIGNDVQTVDELRLWLLKQKQVQDWKTTKATAEACYALLIGGDEWLEEAQLPEIAIGGKPLAIESRADVKVQAGTGYFKTAWDATEITASMAEVKVTNPNKGPAWGAVYWQYFEQLDKIQTAETPLKIKKDLFLQQPTDRGLTLSAITPQTVLKAGDLVKVRIELRVDRDMEYVHMKDMRASGFEPVNVLSQYKWQGGLGYYENTRDAATNFFFDWLPKGTWVFEYPLRVSHAGNFSNGITTVQCMYAPEFTAHSQGIRVQIAD